MDNQTKKISQIAIFLASILLPYLWLIDNKNLNITNIYSILIVVAFSLITEWKNRSILIIPYIIIFFNYQISLCFIFLIVRLLLIFTHKNKQNLYKNLSNLTIHYEYWYILVNSSILAILHNAHYDTANLLILYTSTSLLFFTYLDNIKHEKHNFHILLNWISLGWLFYYTPFLWIKFSTVFILFILLRTYLKRIDFFQLKEHRERNRFKYLFEKMSFYNEKKADLAVENFVTNLLEFFNNEFDCQKSIFLAYQRKYNYFHILDTAGYTNKEMQSISREKINVNVIKKYIIENEIFIAIDNISNIIQSIPHKKGVNYYIFIPGKTAEDGIFILTSYHDLSNEKQWFSLINKLIIMELKNAILYERIAELAIYDGLTKLMNQRIFREKMEEELDRSKRYNKPMSFIMIDIDYFKNYNDTNGHEYGNYTLQKVASLIKKSIRKTDLAFRYGGEEFCCILPETNKERALIVAERIRVAVEKEDFFNQTAQPNKNLTISLGVSTYPNDGNKVTDIIKSADYRLYFAKKNGRNRVLG